MTSCEISGNKSEYHFAGAGKMIEVGKGELEVEDYLQHNYLPWIGGT